MRKIYDDNVIIWAYMAGQMDKLPIQRVDAAAKLGEIVYGDNKWGKNVNDFAARVGLVLNEPDVNRQKLISNDLVSAASSGVYKSSEELVGAYKQNSDSIECCNVVDGFSQSLALALLIKAHVEGNQGIVDALVSGDPVQVKNILPEGMKPMAETVTMVMMPNEMLSDFV